MKWRIGTRYSLVGVEVSELRIHNVHVSRAGENETKARSARDGLRIYQKGATYLSHSYLGLNGAHWTDSETSPILFSALVWARKKEKEESADATRRGKLLRSRHTLNHINLGSRPTDPSTIGMF